MCASKESPIKTGTQRDWDPIPSDACLIWFKDVLLIPIFKVGAPSIQPPWGSVICTSAMLGAHFKLATPQQWRILEDKHLGRQLDYELRVVGNYNKIFLYYYLDSDSFYLLTEVLVMMDLWENGF